MFELFKNKMKKINIKNCDMSIDLIRKYCSIISNATAIPFRLKQAYKEFENMQGLWDYDISSYKKALIKVRKKELLSKCGLSSSLFSNFLFKRKIDNKTYNFGIESTRFTHVIVLFSFQENLYLIDPHLNFMFCDKDRKLITFENILKKKGSFFSPNKKEFYKSIITKDNIDEFSKRYDLIYKKNIFFVEDIKINNINCEHYKFECGESFIKRYYEPLIDNIDNCINLHPTNKDGF